MRQTQPWSRPSWYLHVQSQQWKHQKTFSMSSKLTIKTPERVNGVVVVSLLFSLNKVHILLWWWLGTSKCLLEEGDLSLTCVISIVSFLKIYVEVCGLVDYLFNLILSLTKYVNIYYMTIKDRCCTKANSSPLYYDLSVLFFLLKVECCNVTFIR